MVYSEAHEQKRNFLLHALSLPQLSWHVLSRCSPMLPTAVSPNTSLIYVCNVYHLVGCVKQRL